ncbi:O-antigen ligase family protein [Sulfitobacter sp.]|uniref:O-antigen ligase family protein n=1 Tax=Sulfitobacter sp. TaxID=1903071 RepID=UPI00356540FC
MSPQNRYCRDQDALAIAPRAPRTYAAISVGVFLALIILPIGFNVGSLFLSGVRFFLVTLSVPLAVNLLRGHYGALRLPDAFFALHFGWMVLALWMNNPDQMVQNAGATGAEFFGAYLLGRACIRSSDDFLTLIRVLVGCIVLCSPFAIFEAITGTSLLIEIAGKIPVISAPTDLSIDKRLGLERVQLGFEHPIHWGLFCSIGTALCFVGLAGQLTLPKRVALTLITCIAGLSALSSGAILAIAIQVGLILWATLFEKTAKRWVILLGVLCLCYLVVDLASNRTPLRVFMTYATFSAHSAYWRATIFEWGMVNVWANPIWGLGLKDWVRPIWMHTPSVDNFWLLIAMRYGLPGFSLLAAGYIYALWRIGTRSLQVDDRQWKFRRAWMFCMLGLTFALMTVHIWGAIYAMVFFIFGAGMWLWPQKAETAKNSEIHYIQLNPSFPFHKPSQAPYTRAVVQGFGYSKNPN